MPSLSLSIYLSIYLFIDLYMYLYNIQEDKVTLIYDVSLSIFSTKKISPSIELPNHRSQKPLHFWGIGSQKGSIQGDVTKSELPAPSIYQHASALQAFSNTTCNRERVRRYKNASWKRELNLLIQLVNNLGTSPSEKAILRPKLLQKQQKKQSCTQKSPNPAATTKFTSYKLTQSHIGYIKLYV